MANDNVENFATSPSNALPYRPEAKLHHYLVVGGVLGLPVFLIIVFLCVICCCRKRRRNTAVTQAVEERRPLVTIPKIESNASNIYAPPPAVRRPKPAVFEPIIEPVFQARVETVYIPKLSPNFTEIDPAHLEINEEIGRGEFSVVHRGKLHQPNENQRWIAVKSARSGDDFATNRRALEKELDALDSIDRSHDYVLKLLGGVTKTPTCFYIITELCEAGNLREFLIAQRERGIELVDTKFTAPTTDAGEDQQLTRGDLIVIAGKIAVGMKFLHERRCIHIDLTARRILLTADRTPKIAGFGVYRKSTWPNDFKKIPPKPWQWTAPEVLSELNPYFHQGADVWSYGVLLWEIFSLGEQPYSEFGNEPPEDFDSQLRHGHHRLPQPSLAHAGLYGIMLSCWNNISFDRPHFAQLARELVNLCTADQKAAAEHHHYLNQRTEEVPEEAANQQPEQIEAERERRQSTSSSSSSSKHSNYEHEHV